MSGAGHLFVLAVEAGHYVQAAIGAATSPIERAIELLDHRSRPAVLAYAKLGTLRTAILARQYLGEHLANWHLRAQWYRVPISDGPKFREEIRKTVGRYETGGVTIRLHHIDMVEYFASRRRASMAVRRRFTASRGALKYREAH